MSDYDRNDPRIPGSSTDPLHPANRTTSVHPTPDSAAAMGSIADGDNTSATHGDVKYGYRRTGLNTPMFLIGGLIILAGIFGLFFWNQGVGDNDPGTTASIPPASTTTQTPAAPAGTPAAPNRVDQLGGSGTGGTTAPASPARP